MRPKDRIPTLAAALLLLLCVAPAQADDGEAAGRTYAREQLIRNAKLSVDPTNPKAGGLDELQRDFAAKGALYRRLAPDEHARALLLLGSGPQQPGLIREAARLYRWLASAPAEDDPKEKDPTKLPRGLAGLRTAAAQWQGLVDLAGKAEPGEAAAERWLHPYILALVDGTELETALCKADIDAREKAVTERVQLLRAEEPPRGLVNDRTVEEKAVRARGLRKAADAYERRRAAIVAALDRMARAERMLKEDSGRLGFLIDEARREEAAKKKKAEKLPVADPKKGAPREPPKVSEKLAGLQLEEIVDEQQLRLLYIAARRADLLLANYGDALRQAKEEALAAEEAHKSFEAELSRMRRARQLERLAWQASELERDHKDARAQSGSAPEAVRPIWAAYATALENLQALNKLTREAVELRRGLEARAKPDCAPGAADAGSADGEGCLPPPAPPPDAPAQETEAEGSKDPLRGFRNPRKETIDANYVRDASELLDHESWGADLAAAHFVAVDDRIVLLEDALGLARDTTTLRERFAAAAAAADAALSDVYERADEQKVLWRWYSRVNERRQKNLATDRTAFKETVRGIDEQRAKIRSDLVVFRDYRRRLLGLGTRSFQIRVQRTLDPDRLQAAYNDVDATLARAGRWLTLRGDEHAGTFVQRNWLMLLACLGVLMASIAFVRYGRHALDRVLRTMATRVPALRSEPVTVRAEEAQARREKAVQEAAAKKAEEDALRQVSKEEADRQQKMGEGGYSGGDDA